MNNYDINSISMVVLEINIKNPWIKQVKNNDWERNVVYKLPYTLLPLLKHWQSVNEIGGEVWRTTVLAVVITAKGTSIN